MLDENFESLQEVDDSRLGDAVTGYEESLEIFKSVLDKLDEYTNNHSVGHDSMMILSSNQSNTLINSLSRINNSTISSIMHQSILKQDSQVKMDSAYIVNQLLKRRKEYRLILEQKQNSLRNKNLSSKPLNRKKSLLIEKIVEDSAEERLRQFHEFSTAQKKLTNDELGGYDNSLSKFLNSNNDFQVDNLQNYNFKQENDEVLFRTTSIETWNRDEVLENYDEILEKYLLHSSSSNDSIQQLDGDENNLQFFNNSIFSKPPEKQSLKLSLIIGLIVALGGLVYGFDSGLINNLIGMSYFVHHFQTQPQGFTTSQISIIVTSLSIGTFTGALLAPYSMDRFGRKPTIICSVWVFLTIGNIVQITAANIGSVIGGRLISGFGVGILSAAIPNYQSEISHKDIRGAIICTFQWAITWGLLLSSVVSQGTHNMQNKASYQIPMGLQFVWALLLGVLMFYLPESPRYYVMKGQLNKAAEALSFVRGVSITDTGLLEELVEIKANYEYETSLSTNGGILDCFRDSPTRYKQRLRLFTAITLQFFQQLSGINFIFYYGVSFFQKTGIHSTYILSLITYAVNVVFNIPGLFLIDLIGRRQLLIWGAIIMTVSNYIVAIISTVKKPAALSKKGLESIKLSFICTFIAGFSATFGGCTWVVSAEIFPLGIRSQCISISAAANWFANVVCAVMTPFIFDEGSSKDNHKKNAHSEIFFLWASLNLFAIFGVWFLVYETSGLTLEEIDELYINSKNARDSVRVNKNIKSGDSYMTGFLTVAKGYRNNNKNKNNKPLNTKIDEVKTCSGKSSYSHTESDLADNATAMMDEYVMDSLKEKELTPQLNTNYNSLFEIVAAQNKELSQSSETPNESDENAARIKEDGKNSKFDLGNGLEITAFPKSIPSSIGISTGFHSNEYMDKSDNNILYQCDIKQYLNMKEQSFSHVHPIFIANQGMSEPPQLSSDEDNDSDS
ncbi:hypothetical protein QEN19_003028 [Hanseniaspora menglaensis]